jgi:hypothetical protein
LIIFSFQILSCIQKNNESSFSEIKPWAKNPYYWEYKSEPIILLGGSDDDNLFQWNREELKNHLDLLQKFGGNFIRNTMSSRDSGNLEPFKKLETGLYDLDQWEPEYWQRLENLLELSCERDIIVQIELWDPHDWFYTKDIHPQGGWKNRAFNPEYNINYTAEETGLPTQVDYSPIREGANNHKFFHAPFEETMSVVRNYQERYIEKILKTSLPYPNVLYCINNESYLDISWSVYWLDFVRKTAKELVEPAYVTDMRLVPTTEIVTKYGFDYAEISQSASELFRPKGSGVGEGHFKTIQDLVSNLNHSPVPFNSVKQYGTLRDEKWSNEGIERVWRTIFGGQAGVRFHRPPSGLGLSERAQNNIRSLRMITDTFDLKTVKPHQDLKDLFLERETNSAYMLGEKGKSLAVFFTSTGEEAEVDLSSFGGKVLINWLDTNTGVWRKPEDHRGNEIKLVKPGNNQCVAFIKRD